MISRYFLLISLLAAVCVCQRPSYAGSRPIGYPDVEETTEAPTTTDLDVKFGFSKTTTTERLPIEAMGDRKLVEALRKLPIDKQPFWLINAKHLEDNRSQPKTYPLKQNSYLDHITTSRPTRRPQTKRIPRLRWPYIIFAY